MSSTCSTLARSSASELGPDPNQASRISPSSASDVARRLSARTLASFQRRAPAAVGASPHSAARIPATLLAALVAAAAKLLDEGVGDTRSLVGCDGDAHAHRLGPSP